MKAHAPLQYSNIMKNMSMPYWFPGIVVSQDSIRSLGLMMASKMI